MKIELKTFSGRPNPRWNLATEEISDLLAVIMRLPHHGSAFPLLHIMGYRGIHVLNEDPAGPWTDLIVYHEQVTVRTRDRTDYLFDEDCSVENVLLETAHGRVSDALLERIRSERQSTGA